MSSTARPHLRLLSPADDYPTEHVAAVDLVEDAVEILLPAMRPPAAPSVSAPPRVALDDVRLRSLLLGLLLAVAIVVGYPLGQTLLAWSGQ